MANPFGTEDMAAGYATSRPAVHPRVIEQVYRQLGRTEPFPLALDIGCGAGASTKALGGFARRCIGLEPMEAMLKWASTIAPFACFVVGTAEAIPLSGNSIDLITAAGSLNYAKLDLFFPEAARVLKRDGVLVVYDFSPGRNFRDATGLDEWFSSFYSRYPPPDYEARYLSPSILAEMNPGFRVDSHQSFEIGITLTPTLYLDYVMTETNVAAALRRAVPRSEIRSWCTETLVPVWNSPEREVLFRGYFVCMSVA
jgi:SAM-dependent methyltransferase